MSEKHIMGIDVGTSLIKLGIYNQNGNCVSIVTKEAPAQCPKPGVFIQNGQEMLTNVVKGLKEIMEKSEIDKSTIEALGFSGQMGGAIGVDKDFNALTEWSNPLDIQYLPYVKHMFELAGDEITILSGTNAPYFGPKLLWWKNEFKGLYRNVYKFVFLTGYIIGKLSNISAKEAFVDRSYLQMTGFADINKDQWSESICKNLGIEIDKLPKITPSSSVVGGLSKKISEECGLLSGTPLVAGAGDKPSGYIGAGIVKSGYMIDESASVACLSLCVDKYTPDIKHKTLEIIPSPINGYFYPTIVLMGSGVSLAWFKDTFAGREKQEAIKTGKSVYELLDKLAEDIPPGSDSLLSIGHLSGRATPIDPDIKGMWLGHTWSHTKGHFYRALMESYAYEYASGLKKMKDLYPEVDINEIRVIGGGSKSDLWNQIKSDVLNLPYIKLKREDFTLLGNAIIAGKAVGIFDDLSKTAEKFSRQGKRFTPDKKNYKLYKSMVEIYEDSFDRVRNIYVSLKNIADHK